MGDSKWTILDILTQSWPRCDKSGGFQVKGLRQDVFAEGAMIMQHLDKLTATSDNRIEEEALGL